MEESKYVVVVFRAELNGWVTLILLQAPSRLDVQELARNSDLVAEEFVSWLIRAKNCRRIEFEEVAI